MYYSKDAFLNEVCREISFKEAHNSVRKELEMHIDDMVENFIEEGFEEKEALIKAVQSMGEPKEIGANLNKVHKAQISWKVVAVVGILSFIGVIFLFIARELPYGNGIIFAKKQLLSIGIGTVTALLMYNIDYRKLISHNRLLYFLAILLTITAVIFGTRVNNSVFLQAGIISFEVSKFYNLLFIIAIIGMLIEVRGDGAFGLIKLVVFSAIGLFCLYINSNRGFAFIMTIVYLSIITIAVLKNHFSINNRRTYLVTMYGFIVFVIAITRLLSGFEAYSSEVTELIYASRWTGDASTFLEKGFSNFPNNWADYELLIIASKLGWSFASILIVLFILLIILMIFSTLELKSMAAYYLSTTIIIYLACSCTIGIITGFGLIDGINSSIPFISFGSANYITDSILIGIYLSIWRRNLIVEQDIYQPIIKSHS
ncbi:permease prefix domain 1-containing protein [Desnuesiella massiliensis]|uniref:permease prefix domain 1-containing protein n=1 Tax=Desnuesiella massiliensis TaxID=1650662 RepID=UPI0006E28584|nr:permease prefix domain 1-containing protein [Desnuesiella massiliensis]